MTTCRCGWSGDGDHRHRGGKAPGQRQLYVPTLKFSLAGVQPKLSVSETWGCDGCWASFQKPLEENPNR